jgi:hypothetical protein
MKPIIALFLAASTVRGFALDLTPRFASASGGRDANQRPYFEDGPKKYAIKLNSETDLIPDEGGALFRFTTLRMADMRLRLSPFSVDTKFDSETLPRYEQEARKLIPRDAKDVVLESQTPNPLPINDWQGHRFTFSFRTAAGQVRESITFLDITETQQIIVLVASFAKDFDDASERARDIIRRWHELVPDAGAGGS